MKMIIGIIIGLIITFGCAFTYNVNRSSVDVRLIDISGHDYIVGTAVSDSIHGGCSISIVHHVGCKRCTSIIGR